MIFLGGTPPRGVIFSAPGAMHNARWMAKALYSFKIWMFRSQFKLIAKQCRGLRDLCIFFAIIYVKAWTTASRSAEAPLNDLELLKSLQAYSAINERISDATVNKFKGHLWYLSEDLVGLALFDDNVSAQTKDEMVAAMTNKEGEESPLKRVNIDLRSLNCATLVDFTTQNSKKIFTKLSLPQDFLDIPAADWSESPEFQEAKAAVDSLAVVNDHAERGVALIQAFSGQLTHSEDGLQDLLQLVEENRNKYPEPSKRALMS